jgi:PTS system ascorbate-specific IIA component
VLAEDDPQLKEDEARTLIAQLESGNGVLILTDLFGATPSNIARRLFKAGSIEGITGVNLPMILRAACYNGNSLAEVAKKVLDSGRNCTLTIDSDSGSCDVTTGRSNH